MWLSLSSGNDYRVTSKIMALSSLFSFSKRGELIYTATDVMVIICSALALYNSLELLALILITFKRRSGLYFWSLSLTTFGIIPYSLGWLLDYFDLVVNHLGMASNSIGWILLVTGQSVVLYSRLHLVLYNEKILRAVLWMIIANGCIWHTTMTVLLYTKTSGSSRRGNHNPPIYNTLEKVQLTFFCAQEFIISGLYIWKVVDIIQSSLDRKRRFMWCLFGVNIIIVIMDIALLVVMYKNHFLLEQGIKMVIYSVKLKLEFATLGKLVEFVQSRGRSNLSGLTSHHHTSEYAEFSSNRSRAGDKKSRSSSTPDTVCLEDLTPGPGTSSKQANEQTMATKKTGIGGSSLDAHDTSANQLYGDAIRQISSQ